MKKSLALASTALLLAGFAAPAVVSAQDDFSVVMITDQGGVDDKSFNQSAWEGIQAWGEENGKERGVGGFDYLQSNSDSDYITNLNSAVQANFDITFGIGFKLETAINDVAQQFPDNHFAIVDSFVDQPNVASLNFKDHEAAFLAGVAAASTSETGHIGFIGGVEGVVIDRFEAGYVAGAKTINPDIQISVEYVGSFADAPRGRQLAAAMYTNGADIIFQAAGESGNGVFSEAKDLVANDPSLNIWVVGVDMDQEAEGVIEIDGEERHLTLTSTLKQVGESVKLFIEKTQESGFEAGNTVYGLADGGVGITDGNMSEESLALVKEYSEKIVAGEVEIPETPEN
ncbi:BMP family ABC transporter substrate-binding protein [Aerococcaceae bacterium DSM 109653]|uniref:BMP family ABC transporter substrate-binding protein n=1 Tax=Fundicoccus ignavus TaxID=2664442 RepID=A0A6I2GAR8_9LACT|nr:BMP family ABC transporter substrate-binding protein [Fundicoccus ignavus]MRI80623.1 BMP family ABC transporter substrate-binding protein [Fundicoccus ignavus]MRI84857.1 BMP family ABC transporter substrate-binding protein [Fundicoccus ignavus]